MGRIETGVDRLVKLVAQNDKIVDKAAKELGVSKLVVTEWAEFLKDEGLISAEYSLKTTYLKPKELSKKEVEKKAAQFSTQKEAFARRVETAIQKLESDGAGFEQIRKEFEQLKGSLGDELKEAAEQLDELKKYEKLKGSIDEDIDREVEEYQKKLGQAAKSLEHEQERFETLLERIETEEKALEQEKQQVSNIEELERHFVEQKKELEKLLSTAGKELKQKEDSTQEIEKHLESLRKQANELHEELDDIKKEKLDPLRGLKEEHEKAIQEIHEKISEQAKKTKESVSGEVKQGQKAISQFDEFFKKRLGANKMVDDLDKQKKELQQELEHLRKSAVAWHVSAKGDTKAHLKEMEKSFNNLEKRQKSFTSNVKKLLDSVLK